MVDLSRSLLKDFADLTNDSSSDTKKSNYVRGTVKVSGDKKYVQIDGSTSLTPISEVVDVQVDDRVLVSIENHVATIIGNFTFPPSARKEQEAIDKAEDAKDIADSANEAASDASLLAQSAKDKAEEAQTTSSQASSLASEAKNTAEEAKTSADAASTAASEAKESAAGAATDAATARKDAADAQAAVADAKSEIATITKDVTTVKSDVAGALEELEAQAAETEAIKSTMETNYAKKTEVTTVETTLRSEITQKVGELQSTVEETYAAKSDLTAAEGRLQSQITQNAEGLASTVTKVEKVESDTAQAQADVAEALSKASSAQTAAADAQSKATAAQTAATEAKTNAADAQSKATAAQTTADAAQAKADAADKAVQSAQTDLNEAKQNLANVTNRVDATEEEIAAAQAAVDAAQESVNQALADAATANYAADAAQKAADKAKEDALAAQTAADSAQAKADNAQTAADKAQADATQAQKDVAALTSRVTSAETKIEQNSEQIELTATKTEEIGDKLINDYYTREQADAAIKVSADGIKSTVSRVEETVSGTIKSTVEQFYLSSSPTSLSGGSWSNTQPTWTQGKYIWRRTLVTYANGNTAYTPSANGVCITGNTGAQGATGAPGTSVTINSTSVTYQVSSSGTTIPTGTWLTSIPTVPAGQYLWTKTVVTYSDGKSTTAYSVSRSGANGQNGADGAAGKGISSISERYAVSASNTTAPTSWSTSVPTMTETNRYLWNYEIITYTDSSTEETAKRVIGVYGNKGASGSDGADGEDGRGIQSITNYYLASASSSGVTTSTSGWTTSVQATDTTKRYLWNYEKVTYTDGQSTTIGPRIIGTHGATGPQGVRGPSGENGQTLYTWLKYADSPTSGMSDSPTNKKYIGLAYNKTTATESSNYSDYTWSLIKGADGEDGAQGPKGDDGQTLYTWIKYADTATGGGMSDSPDGKEYIGLAYNKTTPTESNTASDYTWSLIKGADGADGEDGIGIKSTEVRYQASTSGTTVPTGTWSATIPTVSAGQYLWTRTIITYTDDKTTTSYSVSRMGQNGAAGKGISKTEILYYLSTSNTTQTGGSWVTSPPAWVNGRYYWQKIKTTYTDNTTSESTPVCITGAKGSTGSTGAAGADGSDGRSVYSITTQFYLSSSKTSQTGGSWVTTMPTWSYGKYLWTRNKIVYNNPDGTEYTTPICDSSWEAVNEIDIGAKNLALKSKDFTEGDEYWTINSLFTRSVDDDGFTIMSASRSDETSLRWNRLVPHKYIPLEDMHRGITVSFDFKCDKVDELSNGKICSLQIYNSKGIRIGWYEIPNVLALTSAIKLSTPLADGVWTRVTVEFTEANLKTVNSSNGYTVDDVAYTSVSFNLVQNGSIHFRKVKIEYGNKATDWTPAPEDMATSEEVKNAQSIANEANATADSAFSKVTTAESAIQQLSDSISMLVTDENGNSMMTQTSDGWTFNMGSINQTLNDAGQKLDEMAGDLGAIDSTINNLENLANDLSQKTAYVTMSTDESGSPCIELGKSDNPFKVRVTNTSVDFIDGTTKVAYISNQSLYIERAVIKDELQIGEGTGFVWKKRANGNMGLRWVGGN